MYSLLQCRLTSVRVYLMCHGHGWWTWLSRSLLSSRSPPSTPSCLACVHPQLSRRYPSDSSPAWVRTCSDADALRMGSCHQECAVAGSAVAAFSARHLTRWCQPTVHRGRRSISLSTIKVARRIFSPSQGGTHWNVYAPDDPHRVRRSLRDCARRDSGPG